MFSLLGEIDAAESVGFGCPSYTGEAWGIGSGGDRLPVSARIDEAIAAAAA